MARLKILLPGLLTVLASTALGGATLTVGAAGDGDFADLQVAIDAAADGDTVLVKPGLHLVCAPLTFRGKAITVVAEAGPAQTTIRRCEPPSGPDEAMVIVFRDGEGERSVLEGFTVTGYLVDLEALQPPSVRSTYGGGILCVGDVRPTFRNCFVGGLAADYGGGIACLDGAAPTVSRSTFAWNLAFGGGGIYVQESSPRFEECRVEGNVAELPDTGGGGVLCVARGAPEFARCVIAGNVAGCGAAVHVDDTSPVFESCAIFGHSFFALEVGCTDCETPIFVNCTTAGNERDGFVCHGFVAALFRNCVLASAWHEGWSPWSDTTPNLSDADPLFVSEGVIDFTRWSVVELAGREIRVPRFVVEEPDLRLRPGSPAIDAGAAAGAPDTDLDGNARPLCRGVDLGAYEFPDCDAIPARFRRGDCNDDGAVDIADGACVLNWLFLGGPAPACHATTNVNGDERVNVADPSYLFNFLFLGGPQPVAPFPGCGTSDRPADEALGCEGSPAGCR